MSDNKNKLEELLESAEDVVENVVEAIEDAIKPELPIGLKDLSPPSPQEFEVEHVSLDEPEPELPKTAVPPFKRVDTKQLYRPFAEKLQQLVVNCAARGVYYVAIEGYRSPERQNELYAKGRSKPGKKVTNAKAWESFHQFFIAMDFCRDEYVDRAGLQPDWDLESYRVLAEEAQKLGLEAAFFWKSFKEGPHVQLPVAKYGITKEQLRELGLTGGQKAIFALLDRYQW